MVGESAVASGVRRIEAVTGEAALRHVGQEEAALRESAGLLKIPPLELPRRIQKLLDEQKQLEKQLAQLEARAARSRAEELVASAKQVAGVAVLAARLDGLDPDGLRSVVDILRERLGPGIICVGSAVDGKVNLIAAVSKDLSATLSRRQARAGGGQGGGRRRRRAARPGAGGRQGSGKARCRACAGAGLGGADGARLTGPEGPWRTRARSSWWTTSPTCTRS